MSGATCCDCGRTEDRTLNERGKLDPEDGKR